VGQHERDRDDEQPDDESLHGCDGNPATLATRLRRRVFTDQGIPRREARAESPDP
jgi:hypothetical protein